ncbi:STAS domain-containing protein [Rhodococcus sp. BP-252]|uniref:STAS domain-containing protein n=1 Tax=Rhodococcoides kyotonense TaxID=398843 RepID=A0A177YK24_9NOCA|nr:MULTISPECIES: STAS domain-containing protein [Rhodococcus]MBY6410768.1 STAS domain-containing protein [Rhodococcus sp. BP-320]MBY6415407.1 STAS domain-containing protein [Rhodococcus sp. BP-321]MBY6420022.1 STAS domain-containing protein [Rhodococcus sp. BP-324]MBY6425324.1 STAS domain-containing protein [Rhodococcus sp. BP-323]MBY6430613.1 STAS domain-containing protein [Rhodococcus sp. BP-322]
MSSNLDTVIESIREKYSYTIEVELYSAEYAVVRASGELDMSSRSELVATLDRFVRPGVVVDVDLSAVAFMYSGAANAVIAAAARADGRLRVMATTRPVKMIFQALDAEDLLVDELLTH